VSEPSAADLDAIEERADYGAWNKKRDVLALIAEVRRLRADLAACREVLAETRAQFFDAVEVGWRKRMLDRLDAALEGRAP
jgi:hypothetical protein